MWHCTPRHPKVISKYCHTEHLALGGIVVYRIGQLSIHISNKQ